MIFPKNPNFFTGNSQRRKKGEIATKPTRKNTIFRTAISKGYTDQDFTREFNKKYDKTFTAWQLRVYTNDDPQGKTDYQLEIAEMAKTLAKQLKTRTDKTGYISFRAREAGFNVKELWEIYLDKFDSDISYTHFAHSLRDPLLPNQRLVAMRAEAILAELIAGAK